MPQLGLTDSRGVVLNLLRSDQLVRKKVPMDSRDLGQFVSRITTGAKVIIVSNREPWLHERDTVGVKVVRPASGMVTALEPIVRATGGIWVAHGSGSADRLVTDDRGRIGIPPEGPRYTLRRVWLTKKEEGGYYYGISNQALWPLCHIVHSNSLQVDPL